MREIAVDFVYSLKKKRRFNSRAKCTVWIWTKLRSLLLAVRTSAVATASKQVKWSSTFNLPLSSLTLKTCSFSVVKNKQTPPRFLVLEKFISCLPPEKTRNVAFIPSVVKRVQRWRASWIRYIPSNRWVQRRAIISCPNLLSKKLTQEICVRDLKDETTV